MLSGKIAAFNNGSGPIFRIELFLLFLILLFTETSYPDVLPWQRIFSAGYVKKSVVNSKGFIFCTLQSYNGHDIYYSADDGKTWKYRDSGIYISDPKIIVAPNDLLFAFGDYGNCFKSTNDGETWNMVSVINEKTNSYSVNKNSHIIAGTDSGNVCRSTDNGQSWQYFKISGKRIVSVAFDKNSNVYALAEYDTLYYSHDQCVSWQGILLPSKYASSALAVNDSSNIYVLISGIPYFSSDNGKSWEYAGLSYRSWNSISIDMHNYIYASSYEGLYRSTNNGKNWDALTGYSSVYSTDFHNDNIYISTWNGLWRYIPNEIPDIANNFLPMQKGNMWLYYITESSYYHGNYAYNILADSVIADTVIRNKKYFKTISSKDDWQRYDYDLRKLFVFWNDTDRVHMDFNVREDSNFNSFRYKTHNYLYGAWVKEGLVDNLGQTNRYKSLRDEGVVFINDEIYYENIGIGEVKSYRTNQGNYSYSQVLIQYIINDSAGVRKYKTGYLPEIVFTPVDKVNSDTLKLNMAVNHHYTNFNHEDITYQGEGICFIDTVLIHSYYSNDSLYVYNPPEGAQREFRTSNFSLKMILNTGLLKKGYSFFYKITAKDKGILPVYKSLPDTGYYKLNYDSLIVDVKDNNVVVLSYSLMQSYPNPANPTTVICYSIPIETKVNITVYNMLGQVIKELVNESKPPGSHQALFNGAGLSSGIYFYRLSAGGFSQTRKFILLK